MEQFISHVFAVLLSTVAQAFRDKQFPEVQIAYNWFCNEFRTGTEQMTTDLAELTQAGKDAEFGAYLSSDFSGKTFSELTAAFRDTVQESHAVAVMVLQKAGLKPTLSQITAQEFDRYTRLIGPFMAPSALGGTAQATWHDETHVSVGELVTQLTDSEIKMMKAAIQ